MSEPLNGTSASTSTSTSSATSTKIEKGSLVLVTGGGGLVGSSIVHQLLVDGFRVKTTTRSISKLEEMKKKADDEFGAGKLEVVEVKDLSVKGALNEALKGCSGVIHVASVTSEVHEIGLHQSVKVVVSMTEEILQSAKATESVKSFVLTSSRIAICNSKGDSEYKEYSVKDWNDEAFELAENEQNPEVVGLHAYAASKVAGEKAFWSFVEREKPTFRATCCNPDVVFGAIRNPAPGFYSTSSLLQLFAQGQAGYLDVFFLFPTYFVDADDVAKLHVIALIDESLSSQRIITAAEAYTASSLQATLQEINPNRKEVDISRFPKQVNLKLDNQPSVELLKKHYGKGYSDLKTTLEANDCFKA